MSFKNPNRMVLAGNSFEITVGRIIKPKCKSIQLYNYEFTSPLTDRALESDLLLITKSKIYCIECKHFTTAIYGNTYDQKWKFISKGNKGLVTNPLINNYKHVRVIKGLLYSKYNELYDIENIVCVPDGCVIHTDNKEVMNLSTLVNKIVNDNKYKEKKYDLEEIKERIDSVKSSIRR
ncbi:Nuclease-related domain protein [compost metagenome]